jgi:hypothetical protein
MKIQHLFIILVFSFISLASTCKSVHESKAASNTYKLSGKIRLINNCTNNLTDLPDNVLVEADLIYMNGDSDNFIKYDFHALPVIGANNQKEASYEFSVTTSNTATNWKIKRITRDSGVEICNQINCQSGQNCIDSATKTYTTPANDGDSDPTSVTNNVRFDCECE